MQRRDLHGADLVRDRVTVVIRVGSDAAASQPALQVPHDRRWRRGRSGRAAPCTPRTARRTPRTFAGIGVIDAALDRPIAAAAACDVRVGTGRDRGVDRRAERRALVRTTIVEIGRPSHVGVDLHEQRVLRQAPGDDELGDRHAGVVERLDDRAGAVRRRLDQRPVDVLGPRGQGRPSTRPLSSWSTSTERLPLCQSSASSPCCADGLGLRRARSGSSWRPMPRRPPRRGSAAGTDAGRRTSRRCRRRRTARPRSPRGRE